MSIGYGSRRTLKPPFLVLFKRTGLLPCLPACSRRRRHPGHTRGLHIACNQRIKWWTVLIDILPHHTNVSQAHEHTHTHTPGCPSLLSFSATWLVWKKRRFLEKSRWYSSESSSRSGRSCSIKLRLSSGDNVTLWPTLQVQLSPHTPAHFSPPQSPLKTTRRQR